MTKKKPEQPEWDDGRTIANMNVDGMPWYSPGKRISRRKDREKPEDREEVLTKQESRYYTWGAPGWCCLSFSASMYGSGEFIRKLKDGIASCNAVFCRSGG